MVTKAQRRAHRYKPFKLKSQRRPIVEWRTVGKISLRDQHLMMIDGQGWFTYDQIRSEWLEHIAEIEDEYYEPDREDRLNDMRLTDQLLPFFIKDAFDKGKLERRERHRG
jgi:hypothetical protein